MVKREWRVVHCDTTNVATYRSYFDTNNIKWIEAAKPDRDKTITLYVQCTSEELLVVKLKM